MRTTELHNLLKGKRGIVFGVIDSHSLAWQVACKCVQEGADLLLTNTEQAMAIGQTQQLGKELGVPVIPCDATQMADIERLLNESMNVFGGKIDFILHSVAMSQNMRRHRPYTNVNYAYYNTTLDISAVSLHKLLQACMKLDALNEYASVVTLSFIAAQKFMDTYGDMSDAKALLESIVRNMGGVYGQKKHVRVNAISQSPTITRAEQGFKEVQYFHRFAEQMSPLGLASAEDCAKLCVMMFSDYSRGITMQTLYNDGGFSQTVMSGKFIEFFRDTMEGLNTNNKDEI
ncbi:MAG: SDR family oxidoreductase [Bacteroidales bacterium]|nr:SDR family oxidoreductase [Bacteroidales bacterium]